MAAKQSWALGGGGAAASRQVGLRAAVRGDVELLVVLVVRTIADCADGEWWTVDGGWWVVGGRWWWVVGGG